MVGITEKQLEFFRSFVSLLPRRLLDSVTMILVALLITATLIL
jgi:hypothetical protein